MGTENKELRHYIGILFKRRYLILIGTWMAVIAAVLATSQTIPQYQSTAKILITNRSMALPGSASAGDSFNSIMVSERLAKTYSDLIKGRTMASRVISELGLKMSIAEFQGKISAEPIRDTQLIKITVTDEDPERTRLMTNTAGRVLPAMVQSLEGSDNSASNVKISVAETGALPTSPVKPKPMQNLIMGLLAGLLVSIGLAFLLEQLDVSVKSTDDIANIMDTPVLGLIPKLSKSALEAGDRIHVISESMSISAEAYRSLRTNIQYSNFDGSLKVIAVTSAEMGEGKSTVASNLAAILAQAGSSVVIVDCDLRRPRINKYFEVSAVQGLSNVLIGSIQLSDVLIETKVPTLKALTSGPIPPNPADLLGSERMRETIERLEAEFDYVVLDCPPILPVADAAVLSRFVQRFLFVVKAGSTSKQAVTHARDSLEKVGAKVAGVILNGVGSAHGYGYYEKGYYNETGKGKKKEAEPANMAAAETAADTVVSPNGDHAAKDFEIDQPVAVAEAISSGAEEHSR